jgi:L-threonylcarbamoyladenylate synthase
MRRTRRIASDDHEGVAEAARALRTGALVAFPTETVYGLGANALSEEAVRGIFTAKGRPSSNPLIVHVASRADAESLARWNARADALAKSFWPGPLTLVLPDPVGISPSVLAGGTTVGLRVPRHAVALAFLQAAEVPVAAPSANRSNRLSPTTAEAVLDTLDGLIDFVIDHPEPCQVGLESTVLDVTSGVPRILRPGMLSESDLAPYFGSPDQEAVGAVPLDSGVHRSPGQLSLHYAPTIPLLLTATPARDATAEDFLLTFTLPGDLCLGTDPQEAARGLYAALRAGERSGRRRIVVEIPPDAEAFAPLHDRLRRAAGRG